MRPSVAFAVMVAAACGSRAPDAMPGPPSAPPANKAPAVTLPLPAGTRIPCDELLDAAVFAEALGERAAITLRDATAGDPEAVAACGLIRGGERPDERQQIELLKQTGRLGVLPGDELCYVAAYCTKVEGEDGFLAQCQLEGYASDPTMGTTACVGVIAAGIDDVKIYRILDEDTGCVLSVSGGPSNVDNEMIATCARTATTHLTPSRFGGR
jgi:hypothetical protein